MEHAPEPLQSEDVPPLQITMARGTLRIPPDQVVASGTVLFRNLELDAQLDAVHDLAPDAASPDLLTNATELHFGLPAEADAGPLPSRSGTVEVREVRLVPDPDDPSAQVFTFQVVKIRFAEELDKPVETPGALAD